MRRPPQSRVTIRDVAEQAGVSLGTASNVLNRPDRVAPDTLARVLDVIDRLGFVRSSAAHQMRGGNSRCFGAVVLDASNPFSTETVRGLEDAVHEQGCAVVLCSTDGSTGPGGALSALARGAAGPGHRDHPGDAQHPPSRDAARPGHPRGAPRPAEQRGRALLGLGRPRARRGARRRLSVRSRAPPDRVHQRAAPASRSAQSGAAACAVRPGSGPEPRGEHHRVHDRPDHRASSRPRSQWRSSWPSPDRPTAVCA